MSTLLRALLRPGLPASRSRLCARRLLSTSDDAEESASEPPLPAPAPERLPVDLLIYSSHLKNVRDYSVKTSQDRLFLQGKLRVHKETEDLRAELARYGPDGGACAALPYVYPGKKRGYPKL